MEYKAIHFLSLNVLRLVIETQNLAFQLHYHLFKSTDEKSDIFVRPAKYILLNNVPKYEVTFIKSMLRNSTA